MRLDEGDAVAEALERLHRNGLQQLWVYAPVNAAGAAEYQNRLARLPVPAYRRYNGPGADDSWDTARKFLASVSGGPEVDVIPQVDVLRGDVRERLDDVLRDKVAAVKIVHDLDLLDQDQD